MPKFSSINTKSLEAIQRRKQQKEEERIRKEAAILDEYWKDDDKIANAKIERRLEQQRKQQEKLQKKLELKQLIESEEAKLVSNKQAKKENVTPKVTRAEILRRKILEEEQRKLEETKKNKYNLVNDQELQPNINHELLEERIQLMEKNIDLINESGLDNVLEALTLGSAKIDSRYEKRSKAAFAAYKEEKMATLKQEFPNLKLSQYNEMIYKMWKKAPENPCFKP